MDSDTRSELMAEHAQNLKRRTLMATSVLAFVAAIVLASLLWTSKAEANTPINEFWITPSSTQAGGHPDIHTLVWMSNSSTQNNPGPNDCECHDAKNVVIDAPAGAIPNVFATPRCTAADFGQNRCPIDAQVGTVRIGIVSDTPGHLVFDWATPVYNLVPHPNQAGLVGFNVALLNGAPVFTIVDSRTEGDYGLEFTVTNINHVFNGVSVIDQTFWGIPADPSHDLERIHPVGCTPFGLNGAPECEFDTPMASNAPLAPFISAPTVCGADLPVGARVESYDLGFDTVDALYPATTGCDQLSFNPSLFAQPTTRQTDTASGIDIDLRVPPAESPIAPSPSEIKASTVTLPPGVSINPNAADGKTACSAEEARVGIRDEAAQCPQSSKVGSLTITSSALPSPLPGYIYLADPKPGDRYRLWLIADGFGQHVKLPPGSVEADPVTGQLTARFEDLPQFPFTDFNMHFFGSERGLLATPDRCGTFPVKSTFTPWDDELPEQTSTQFFTVDEGTNGSPCPGSSRPFDPSFAAGVSNKGAGVHAPFTLDVSRPDGDQNLSGLSVTTPPGFAATLKGIPYCPESAISQLQNSTYSGTAEQAAPTCPSTSQVGTATAGAGAGTHPVYVGGKVYLAGPYKGAPLSLETVIPAVSGPYDLGVVAVRTAIDVNPLTAQVSAVSDPLPRILEGVPLRTRFIRVSLDRDGFALNPTNCDPFSVSAAIAGSERGSAARSTHFQVANCSSLGFGPRLALSLSGSTKRRGHPSLAAVLRTHPGEANISRTSVTLPKAELFENANLDTICTRVQFAAANCPTGSLVGEAEATTPLLDHPLRGPAYLRSSSHELPDLVVALRGQLDIDLVGHIDMSEHSGLRTTFEAVPDAPVTRFSLRLFGGSRGLLVNSENLCRSPQKAKVKMTGQNGIVAKGRVRLRSACSSARKQKRHPKRHQLARKAG
jgi:hypothetical protein